MLINSNLVALDAEAVRTSLDVAATLKPADLSLPTPCAGWTVRDLLAHMTAQHHGFAAAFEGDGDLAHWEVRPLGDDPAAAYRAAAERVLSAFAAGGALDRLVPLPELGGSFPAARAIGFHLVDYVVHSWDLAKPLGIEVRFSPEVQEAALEVARAVPDGEARLRPGAAFKPALPSTGGSPFEDVLTLLGRSPDWAV
ncbi:TIGR03086 family protein [[Actinomadura] parvosata subsp. kistnae]|uniref:TIGR03086 family protein n=1 Tax=[Actinomadura] parvosata subsp. kistnae TaxID=1909395 RepID=A0A1U9ZVG7_9ACTN|nr:TIGR03086 family metal-binding protein [Nonomuraea sp. ATCC 55076]AQZ61945.1 TIGR03086 family protein [Nonomuraea sp. ATCC 55076]